MAVGSSLLIMILGNSMIEATAKIERLKFLPFANSDVSLYIFHLPARPEMTLGFSISVLLVYIFGFLFSRMIEIFKVIIEIVYKYLDKIQILKYTIC